MIIIETYLIHYGVGHDKGGHSGRYPWGSGKNPEVKLARKQAKQAKKEAKEKAKAEKLNAKFDKASAKIRRGKKVGKNVDTLKETMSKMTDEELRAKIDRLRLEGTYTQLLRDANPQKVSTGRKFIDNMKDNIARDVPNVLSMKLKDAMGKKLDQIIKDQFNVDVPVSELLKKDLGKLNDSELKRVTDHYNALKNAKDAKRNAAKESNGDNSRALFGRNVADLTDDELRKANTRAIQEDNYNKRNDSSNRNTGSTNTTAKQRTNIANARQEDIDDGAEFLSRIHKQNLQENLHSESQRDDESGAEFLERILREYR